MSIASFTLSEPTLSETSTVTVKKSKPPRPRTVVAKADAGNVPEAR